MLYNILKDQWQTIEIDRIRSITQETEFSQMAELLYVIYVLALRLSPRSPPSTGLDVFFSVLGFVSHVFRLFSHDAKLGVCRTIWLHVADCATLQLFNG